MLSLMVNWLQLNVLVDFNSQISSFIICLLRTVTCLYKSKIKCDRSVVYIITYIIYTCIAYIYSINPCTLFLMLMHFIFQTSNFANPKHSAGNVKKSKKKDSERTLLINHSDDEDI